MSDRKKKKHVFSGFIFTLLSTIIFALCFIMIIFTMLMHFIGVSANNGMEPTLRQHDVVVVNKLDKTPDIGNIIVYERTARSGNYYVSRVIASGGQTVDIDYENNCVMVDGKEINDVYKSEKMEICGNISFPFTVPENEYFILGDNRNNSVDSRFSEIGTISNSQILGVVFMRVYPYGDIEILDDGMKKFKLEDMFR